MKHGNGNTVSVWMQHSGGWDMPPLDSDLEVAVCIVGAGLAGVTTTYLLACEGVPAVVLEAGLPDCGETLRTTAHLSNVIDDRFTQLEKWVGVDGARLAAASHGAAIDLIERVSTAEAIACDFRRVDGHLAATEKEGEGALIEEMHAARRAGLAVELIDAIPHFQLNGRAALRFAHQARFDPAAYLRGLLAAARRRGVRFHGNTRVIDFGEEDGRPWVRTEAGFRVASRALVVASNSPVHTRVTLHTKLFPYRTYAIAAEVPPTAAPSGLVWDMEDPYHYVRTSAGSDGNELVIIGGEDHKTGQHPEAHDPFERLEHWARLAMPQLGAISSRWSGQVLETPDGLGFIGRSPHSANTFVACGDSGMGMTHSTIAGMLLQDLVRGRSHPWERLYDPSRRVPLASGPVVGENVNVARQYLDLVAPSRADREAALAPAEGRVEQRGLHKVAICRDLEGNVQERSAICTHLGCVVAWNEIEQSWDCPCHGSRFAPDGSVLHGPAINPLGAVETAE